MAGRRAVGDSLHIGNPGGSAQREYDRRRRRDRARAHAYLPMRLVLVAGVAVIGYLGVQLGAKLLTSALHAQDASAATTPFNPATAHGLGLLVAIVAAVAVASSVWRRRQTTSAWATGAQGERVVGAHLAKVASRGVSVVHDRRIPGSQANIDHVAVGPWGIFVIDTKVAPGRVSVRRTGPIWNRGPLRLFVGGRDRSAFIEGMRFQVEAVAHALSGVPDAHNVPISLMVVLVGGGRGWLARPTQVRGVWVGSPKQMARVLRRSGPLDEVTTSQLARTLAMKLPEA